MITLCTGDLEECVRGATETAELLLSSVAPLRQRGLELYVIINKATWLQGLNEQGAVRLPRARVSHSYSYTEHFPHEYFMCYRFKRSHGTSIVYLCFSEEIPFVVGLFTHSFFAKVPAWALFHLVWPINQTIQEADESFFFYDLCSALVAQGACIVR